MSGDKTWCDECGRIKEKSNHWHQIGVSEYEGKRWLEMGDLQGAAVDGPYNRNYIVMDLCGEQCLYKVLGKLLRLNPTEAE